MFDLLESKISMRPGDRELLEAQRLKDFRGMVEWLTVTARHCMPEISIHLIYTRSLLEEELKVQGMEMGDGD